MTDDSALLAGFQTALLEVDRTQARELLVSALERVDSSVLIEDVVVPVLESIGTAWADGHLALAQIYMAGRICEELVAQLLPVQERDGGETGTGPRIGIAVVQDYHLLGKRIIRSMLAASGHTVVDFGGGLSPEAVVSRAIQEGVDILLLSTLMLPSALKTEAVITLLRERGSSIPVVVGGAPFSFDSQLWLKVGADAMGKTASDAISVVARLVGEAK